MNKLIEHLYGEAREQHVLDLMRQYREGNGTLSSLRYSKLTDTELRKVCEEETDKATLVFPPYIMKVGY